MEQTAYDTNPVDDHKEAVKAFAGAYNDLQGALHMDYSAISNELRRAMHQPVRLPTTISALGYISLYEIGLTHAPDGPKHGGYGRLSVHEEKLAITIEKRETEMRTLFVHMADGLLLRLCEILMTLAAYDLPEDVRTLSIALLNECHRLIAIWF